MAGPVPLDMRDRASAPTVQTGVVSGAHTGIGGVEVVECSRKRRQAGVGLGRGAALALEGAIAGHSGVCIIGLGV